MDFAPTPGVVGSASPFVTKVEAWLRFVGLDYEKRHGSLQDFGKASKGKFPIVFHGDNIVPDSHFIIRYLARTYGQQLEAAIAPADAYSHAVAVAVLALVETHLYFGAVYFKWGPQGMGRFAPEDVALLMNEDLKAISALQGDKPFLFGDQPYEADATVFAILDVILYHKGAFPQLEALVHEKYHNLIRYTDHIRDAYFGPSYQPSLVPGPALQKAAPASASPGAKKDD
ncbi:hypothetical protein N2152v2_002102 [Parachlorella kessleri]